MELNGMDGKSNKRTFSESKSRSEDHEKFLEGQIILQ